MPSPMLVDTHCHLSMLDGDPAAHVGQARADGVGWVVDVGVDLPSSLAAAATAARLDGVAATAGVHPHDAKTLDDGVVAELRRLLARPEVAGVGETGLDYHYDHSPRNLQRAAFAVHIRLAKECGKVLVVHCRDAFAEVLAMLADEGPPQRVVFHCFTGDDELAGRVVQAGYTVSFAGIVTFKHADAQRAACAAVPLDQMVLETDSPFLTPHPFRGRPNRPGMVAVTAAAVAAIHGASVAEVARATTATAARVFALPVG